MGADGGWVVWMRVWPATFLGELVGSFFLRELILTEIVTRPPPPCGGLELIIFGMRIRNLFFKLIDSEILLDDFVVCEFGFFLD